MAPKRKATDSPSPRAPPSPPVHRVSATDSMFNPKEVLFPPSGLEWITLPRPMWDVWSQYGSNLERMDDDAQKELQKDVQKQHEKYFEKPVEENPDWPWVVSRQGWDVFNNNDLAAWKRDQDEAGMYVYNDFTGYGLQEVIENQMETFAKEFFSKKPNPNKVYAHAEGLVHWLVRTDLMLWSGIDDAERVWGTSALICKLFLATVHYLYHEDLLSAEKLQSLPVTLAMIIDYLQSDKVEENSDTGEDDEGGADATSELIVAYADHCGIEMNGLWNIKETTETIRKSELYGETKENLKTDKPAKIKSDPWNFRDKYEAFVKKHSVHGVDKIDLRRKSIGGDHYDIFKMSKTHRKRYSLDHTDPLDKLFTSE